MQHFPPRPLTGGLMIIEIPGRKGQRSKERGYKQNKSHKLIRLTAATLNEWSTKPTPKELVRTVTGTHFQPKLTWQDRVRYWLTEHFLYVVGDMQYFPMRCSWKFEHDVS